jgi:serine/threonine protein kinase
MFFQVVDGHQYGCEVDWWSVGLVMYEMMLGLYRHKVFIHPRGYPSYVTKDAESILRMVSCSSALLVSVCVQSFNIHVGHILCDWTVN